MKQLMLRNCSESRKSAAIVYILILNDQDESMPGQGGIAIGPPLPAQNRICYSDGLEEVSVGLSPTYILVEGKTFTKEELTLDNHVFKNCTLDHCKIFYSGGPFELIDTHITESELILNQPAKNIYSAIQIFRMKSPGSRIIDE